MKPFWCKLLLEIVALDFTIGKILELGYLQNSSPSLPLDSKYLHFGNAPLLGPYPTLPSIGCILNYYKGLFIEILGSPLKVLNAKTSDYLMGLKGMPNFHPQRNFQTCFMWSQVPLLNFDGMLSWHDVRISFCLGSASFHNVNFMHLNNIVILGGYPLNISNLHCLPCSKVILDLKGPPS